jgi:hypothetical protein
VLVPDHHGTFGHRREDVVFVADGLAHLGAHSLPYGSGELKIVRFLPWRVRDLRVVLVG